MRKTLMVLAMVAMAACTSDKTDDQQKPVPPQDSTVVSAPCGTVDAYSVVTLTKQAAESLAIASGRVCAQATTQRVGNSVSGATFKTMVEDSPFPDALWVEFHPYTGQ